jgi:hypothetical protein
VLPLLSPASWQSVRTTPLPHTSEKLRSGPAGARGSARVHSQLEIGLNSCVLVAISPRSGKSGGCAPRDAPDRRPSAGPRQLAPHRRARGRSPLGIEPPVVSENSKSFLLKRTLADVLVDVLVWQSMDRCSWRALCVVSHYPYGGRLVECLY